jgi:hypothetical protein
MATEMLYLNRSNSWWERRTGIPSEKEKHKGVFGPENGVLGPENLFVEHY